MRVVLNFSSNSWSITIVLLLIFWLLNSLCHLHMVREHLGRFMPGGLRRQLGDQCSRCVCLSLPLLSGITAPVVLTLTLGNICSISSFSWLPLKISSAELSPKPGTSNNLQTHRHLKWVHFAASTNDNDWGKLSTLIKHVKTSSLPGQLASCCDVWPADKMSSC